MTIRNMTIYEVRSYEITRYEGTMPIYENVVYLRTDDQMEAIAKKIKLVNKGHQYATVVPQNQGYKNDTGKKK